MSFMACGTSGSGRGAARGRPQHAGGSHRSADELAPRHPTPARLFRRLLHDVLPARSRRSVSFRR